MKNLSTLEKVLVYLGIACGVVATIIFALVVATSTKRTTSSENVVVEQSVDSEAVRRDKEEVVSVVEANSTEGKGEDGCWHTGAETREATNPYSKTIDDEYKFQLQYAVKKTFNCSDCEVSVANQMVIVTVTNPDGPADKIAKIIYDQIVKDGYSCSQGVSVIVGDEFGNCVDMAGYSK